MCLKFFSKDDFYKKINKKDPFVLILKGMVFYNEWNQDIIKEEIEKAEKRLLAAKIVLSKDMIEDAANRIYYSLFYAAKAMLNSIGYDAKTQQD